MARRQGSIWFSTYNVHYHRLHPSQGASRQHSLAKSSSTRVAFCREPIHTKTHCEMPVLIKTKSTILIDSSLFELSHHRTELVGTTPQHPTSRVQDDEKTQQHRLHPLDQQCQTHVNKMCQRQLQYTRLLTLVQSICYPHHPGRQRQLLSQDYHGRQKVLEFKSSTFTAP